MNYSKPEFIVFISPRAKQDLSSLLAYVDDSIIQQPSKVRDLGVIVDQFLSFDDYISFVCMSTHFHLRNIGRIRHLLSHHATAQLIHTRILTRTPRRDHITEVLIDLHWLKIKERVVYTLLILTFKDFIDCTCVN